jgi:uncharacterized protein (TIGR03083 family)
MGTRLPVDRYLDLLQADTERIAGILETADLTARVLACPDWSLADLGHHVREVHEFWTWIVREHVLAVDDDTAVPRAPRPADADLAQWLRSGAEELVRQLRDGDPSALVWTWTSQHELAFIQRRMPQETAVHRWDAELAAGDPQPIAADLAADGIDEFFFLASAYDPCEGHERVRLRTTDTGHRWVTDVVDGRQVLLAGDGPADAELAGSASDLLLVLWRRLPPDRVVLDGDRAAVESMLARAHLD